MSLSRLLRWIKPGLEDDIEHGEPGEGRVLVTIRRDGQGHAIERAWVAPEVARQWDESTWKSRP